MVESMSVSLILNDPLFGLLLIPTILSLVQEKIVPGVLLVGI